MVRCTGRRRSGDGRGVRERETWVLGVARDGDGDGDGDDVVSEGAGIDAVVVVGADGKEALVVGVGRGDCGCRVGGWVELMMWEMRRRNPRRVGDGGWWMMFTLVGGMMELDGGVDGLCR